MVLIATVTLVVVTIVTNKDKSPAKTPTMQEWMTSADGIKTLTKALKNVDSSTTFGFNLKGNVTGNVSGTAYGKSEGSLRVAYAGSAGSAKKASYLQTENGKLEILYGSDGRSAGGKVVFTVLNNRGNWCDGHGC